MDTEGFERVVEVVESTARATQYLLEIQLAALDERVREAEREPDVDTVEALTRQMVEGMRVRDDLAGRLARLRTATAAHA